MAEEPFLGCWVNMVGCAHRMAYAQKHSNIYKMMHIFSSAIQSIIKQQTSPLQQLR
jgi:hypothetical protein